MNYRTLTTAEMHRIDALLRRETGGYWEVQVELLDHLAASVEEQWRRSPDRPLAEAVEVAQRSLGDAGVRGIVRERQTTAAAAAAWWVLRGCGRLLRGTGGVITVFIGWLLYRWLLDGVPPLRLGSLLFVGCLALFAVPALWMTIRQYRRGRWYIDVVCPLVFVLTMLVLIQTSLMSLPAMVLERGTDPGLMGGFAVLFTLCVLVSCVMAIALPWELLEGYRKRDDCFEGRDDRVGR